jgi:iron complex outermembrane recepter protein
MGNVKAALVGAIRSLFCSLLLLSTAYARADAPGPQPFDIRPQGLAEALTEFAHQSRQEILFAPEAVAQKLSSGVRGKMEPLAALQILLKDSGLIFRNTPNGAILVGVSGSTAFSASANNAAVRSKKEGKTSSSGGFRLAQTDGGKDSGTAALGESSTQSLEEVVVTATRRSETLLRTPQSVTALSADHIAQLGATQLTEIANTVPSLTFAQQSAGLSQITLRGVTTGEDPSPTVAIYIDDVPYGSSSPLSQNAGILTLNVGLFDIDRVEILRGPQGVLYGASSLGGLVKYVTKAPDTKEFGADVQTGVSSTGDGGGISYNAAAGVNLPIAADLAAVRISGFQYHDGGYIDNVASGNRDANRGNTNGGRLDFLLTPEGSDGPLSIRLTGFQQNISDAGLGTTDYTFSGAAPYGSLNQYRPFPGGEPLRQEFRLGSATINYDFGFARLSSITGYQTMNEEFTEDVTENYAPFCSFIGQTCGSMLLPDYQQLHKLTEEVRLTSQGTHTVDWLVGFFYDRESASAYNYFEMRDLAGQPIQNTLFSEYTPSKFKEIAGYGDVTWHISSRFDIDGGMRWARDDQSFLETGTGLIGASVPPTSGSERARTYLADARYHLSTDAMVYFRYSTGFRPGGPNFVSLNPTTGLPSGPAESKPDQLKDYEVGLKAQTPDRRYGLDINVYTIDWSDILLQTSSNGLPEIVNAQGTATIQGAELTLTALPVRGLNMSASLAYIHAYFNQSEPLVGAAEGERLPGSPRLSGTFSGDYQLPFGQLAPTVGMTVRYVGARTVDYNNDPAYPQYILPAYTAVDLRTGVTLRPATSTPVELQFYIHNLNDVRGQLSVLDPQAGARPAILQPRTVGINAFMHF